MNQPLGVDIDLFEDFLEERWHEDAKCEALHRYVDNLEPLPETCTVSITHRYSSCVVPSGMNVCASFTEGAILEMEPHKFCGVCGKPTAECFELIPV